MSMILKVSSGASVAPGSYFGTFQGVEQVQNEYGNGLRWQFKIGVNGKEIVVSRTTQSTPSPKNGCGRMLQCVIGKALTPGEDIDLNAFVGKKYLVLVGQGEKGSTRVESVSPMPEK